MFINEKEDVKVSWGSKQKHRKIAKKVLALVLVTALVVSGIMPPSIVSAGNSFKTDMTDAIKSVLNATDKKEEYDTRLVT